MFKSGLSSKAEPTHPKPSVECTTRLTVRTGHSTSYLSTVPSGEENDNDVPLDQDRFTIELWLPATCTNKMPSPSSSELQASFTTGDAMNVINSRPAIVSDRVRDQAIYEREIPKKDFGHPIWNPQPDDAALPLSYHQTGISVGDVGILYPSGAFGYLFNVFLDAHHPNNPNELPEGFVPLNTRPGGRTTVPCHTSGYVAGRSMKPLGSSVRAPSDTSSTKSFDFAFSTAEASVLILPEPCYREQFWDRHALQIYASRHGESWYHYANGPRGLNVENGELQVITECDKTTSWAILTHSKEETPSSNDFGDGSVSLSWTADDVVKVQCRASAAQQVSRPRNQCIFLRSSRVYLSDVEWKRVRPPSLFPDIGGLFRSMWGMFGSQPATIGPRRSPDSTCLVPSQPEKAMRTPANVILDMLLKKHPEARIAVVRDDDWCAVIREGDSKFPSDAELCRRVLETFDVVIDGTGLMYLTHKTDPTRGWE